MDNNDDFDKYLENSTPSSKRKGSVKKNLFSTNMESVENEVEKVQNFKPEEKVEKSTTKKQTTRKSVKKEEVVEDVEQVEELVETSIKEIGNENHEEIKEIVKTSKPRERKTKVVQEVIEELPEEIIDTFENEVEETIVEETAEQEKEEDKFSKPKLRNKSKREMSLEDYNTNYISKTLERTIHESMIPYSEFVIMDRALPRVEDGLKPVQRRVLYSMLEVGVLPDRPYKKCATIVGECMGKYHPHGDTSIYDTLVRLAQPFNMGETLVDGSGNFGSIDGDPAAAMRYTEAKLTPLALELLRDLDKDTVTWSLNFDDRLKEPNMLPGRFPNLLVNGCQGIAVGLATNIPTHNFTEACNAVIAFIDNKNITLDEIMKIMPSPDFPSGAYILDNSDLKQIYETGKGKIYIRSKIHIENGDNGKKNIVITEIPYQVNKASMLQKIAKYKESNPTGPMGAIQDIIDESDRNGTRAVIKLKKEAKINSILNILYKYCDVQTTFGANVVAIADGKPKQMGLLEILKYYVDYQQRVIYNRTNHDLEEALKKEHLLEGLLIAIRNIDEVVKIIKNSKNVTEAKITLIKKFELSEIQAQAILDMRLARLTSLEVNKLITDLNRLRDLIKRYTAIIKSPTLQMKVVKSELQEMIKTYGTPRKTQILSAEHLIEGVSSPSIDGEEVEDEDVETYHLITTPANTLKLVNLKSYNLVVKELSNNPTISEVPNNSFKVDNNKEIYIFTNIGNCVRLAVNEIPECKFRDKGISLFSIIKNIDMNENIVTAFEMDNAIKESSLLFVTKQGMVKISPASEYISTKHIIAGIKLAKNDELIYVGVFNPNKKLTLFTYNGNAVKVDLTDVAITKRVSIGIKGIALDKGDYVVGAIPTTISDAFTLFMSDGSAKIIKQADIEEGARNRKGISYISPKSKTAKLVFASKLRQKTNYVVCTLKDNLVFVRNTEIPIDVRTGAGKVIVKEKIKQVHDFVVS